jgi:hypothetical protein
MHGAVPPYMLMVWCLIKHRNDSNVQLFLKFIIIIVKVKVKFSLEWAMKAQRGSRGIALLFL